ncbi:hypothetical protein LINPERHAP1_LOCUS38720 [Linum perenne]
MVRKNPWKSRKQQQSSKISLLIQSILDSFVDILFPLRYSSLCHNLSSSRCPGLPEISVNGCCWIADATRSSFFWFSFSSVGMSTMWNSFNSEPLLIANKCASSS